MSSLAERSPNTVPLAKMPSGSIVQNTSPTVPLSNVVQPVQNLQPQATAKFAENTSVLHIFFDESLESLAGKSSAVKILSVPNSKLVFKTSESRMPKIHASTGNKDSAPVDLTKVVVTKMEVVRTVNNKPVSVGFNWTGQGESCNQFTMDGDSYPLTLHPRENSRIPHTVYDHKEMANSALLLKYGHVSVEDMKKSIQTLKDRGSEWAMVAEDHEIINLIRMNSKKFGPIDENMRMPGTNLYKLSPQIASSAIDELNANIVSKFNFTDLTNFKVTMSRLDGKTFDTKEGTECSNLADEDFKDQCKKSLVAGFDLKLTWINPTKAQKTQIPIAVPQKI